MTVPPTARFLRGMLAVHAGAGEADERAVFARSHPIGFSPRCSPGLQLQSLWRIPTAAVVAYSCNPCGESLLRL